jgi:hypothetical protein
LKRYAAFITLSINQLRARATVADRFPDSARERVRDILLDAVVALCAALGLRIGLAYSDQILDALGIGNEYDDAFQTVLVVVASVFIITALVSLVRHAFRLIEEASFPIHIASGQRRALRETLSYQVLRGLVLMSVMTGGFLMFTFIGAPFANTPVYLVTLVVVILALAFVFQRSVSQFNERFKSTFSEGFRVKEYGEHGEMLEPPAKDLALPQLLSEGDKLCNVIVEVGSDHNKKTLNETEMWLRDDVVILALRRDDELYLDPDGDEVLKENDVVVVLEGCPVAPRGGSDQGTDPTP